MKKFLGLLPFLFLVNTHAAGTIDYLKIDKDVVLFSTTETKADASPTCTTTENADIWSTSLKSESGRAIYSLLVMAMDKNMEVDVTSSQDCGDVDGVERAESVNLVVAPSSPAGSTMPGLPGLYKADGITRVGTIVSGDQYGVLYVDNIGNTLPIRYTLNETSLAYVGYTEPDCKGIPLHIGYSYGPVRHPRYKGGRYVTGDLSKPFKARSEKYLNNFQCSNRYSNTAYELIEADHPVCGENLCILKVD